MEILPNPAAPAPMTTTFVRLLGVAGSIGYFTRFLLKYCELMMKYHTLCHYNTIFPISYPYFKIDIEKTLADLYAFLFKNCEKKGSKSENKKVQE